MRLTVLGCAGGGPTRTAPASGYLVTAGDTAVLLDAGPGTFRELGRHRDPVELSAVVLSHVHVDHCSDFFALYGYLRSAPRDDRLPVFVPDGAAAHLAAFARAGEGHRLFSIFDFTTVGPSSVATVGGVQLRFGAAAHSVPALVTRIDAGGASLVYSGDTGPGGDIAALAAGAGLLVCEATLARDDPYPHHLTAHQAGAVATAAGAARLIVTHLPPTLDPETVLADAAEAYPGPVAVATAGEWYDVTGGEAGKAGT